MLSETLVETIGQLADTCDNYLAFQDNSFMSLSQKANAYVTGLRDVRDQLRALYVAETGENPWEADDAE
jgi:hypothetical protein